MTINRLLRTSKLPNQTLFHNRNWYWFWIAAQTKSNKAVWSKKMRFVLAKIKDHRKYSFPAQRKKKRKSENLIDFVGSQLYLNWDVCIAISIIWHFEFNTIQSTFLKMNSPLVLISSEENNKSTSILPSSKMISKQTSLPESVLHQSKTMTFAGVQCGVNQLGGSFFNGKPLPFSLR